MNVPAAIISAALGAAFFWAGNTYYYRPAVINPDIALDMLSTNHSKARAAVSRLLIDPASAQFTTLRSIDDHAAKYVCGDVKAKDKSGQYTDYRAFVYSVAIDFARIDDDGRIAQQHAAFSACPIAQEEKVVAQQTMQLPPGAMAMVKTIQKAVPPVDPSSLIAMGTKTSPGGASSAKMEQQLGDLGSRAGSSIQMVTAGQLGLASQSGSAGQQANSASKPALQSESEWRSDRPPTAWPAFPADHPLAKPAERRTTAQAMALAADVEDRWEHSKSASKVRPSSDEIREACRALLMIDPNDKEFPKAWATFVRLRKIDRDTA